MVNLMKELYRAKLPKWYESNNSYETVLSDDIDGLVSTSILKYVKNWDAKYFYDFQDIYVDDDTYSKENKSATRVWADVAFIGKDEMTFDNHISRKTSSDWKNNLCINPNLIADVSAENYYDKYCGSTALLIWSIYNLPLPESEEGKMLLLAIDTSFKGYYANTRFRARNKFYLCDMFGFPELYEVEQRHTQQEFYDIIAKYNLSTKTRLNARRLETDLDLDVISELLGIPVVLPQQEFKIWRSFEKADGTSHKLESVKDIAKVITLAFTGKNYICCSRMTKTRQ